MAIVTVLSGSYCHGNEIVAGLSRELGYRLLDESLFAEVSEKHGIPEKKLAGILGESDSLLAIHSKERNRLLAYLEMTLAELIQDDNLVLSGASGFLIPTNIAHVLRVCVIASQKYRIDQAMKLDSLTESEAVDRIQDYDRNMGTCTLDLASKPPYDNSLYDVMLPADKMSPDDAVRLIRDQAQSEAVKTTSWSEATAKDFLLSARVKLALTEADHKVEVFSANGHVIIGINEQALLMGRLEEKLKRIASEIEGVIEVTTKLGTKFNPPSLNPWDSIDAPPKILLVDDEIEFVQTLSERLKTRNIESSIAYDGEQALEMVKDDEPDVIVLDLLMPGIDGIETLRRVKESHPEVEVIILTGHGSDREQTVAEELGAFAYLRKPINVNELAQVMKEAYGRRRQGH